MELAERHASGYGESDFNSYCTVFDSWIFLFVDFLNILTRFFAFLMARFLSITVFFYNYLKGLSHDIYWPIWMQLSLNKNRF
jgi:hypothetical protein